MSRLDARTPSWAAAAALLLVIAIRLPLAISREYPTYDGALYLLQAGEILDARAGDTLRFPQGWPAWIAATATISGASTPAQLLRLASIANACLGALSIALVYWLLLRTVTPIAALAIALAFSFVPAHLAASSSDLSDLLALCLVLFAAAMRDTRQIACGLVFGLAYLTRPEAALMVAAFIAVDLARRRFRSAARTLAGFALAVLPYVALTSMHAGKLLVTEKQSWLRSALDGPSRSYFSQLWALLTRLSGELGISASLIAILGLRRCPWSLLALGLPILFFPLFPFEMASRYWLPALAAVLLGVYFGARTLLDFRGLPIGRRARAWILAGLVLAGVLASWRESYRELNPNAEAYPTLRMAGDWLSERRDHQDIVAARKPYSSFWSGKRFRRVPDAADLDGFRLWLYELKPQYLIVHQGIAGGMAPVLVPFLGELPSGFDSLLHLETVITLANRPLDSVLIYSVNTDLD